MNKYLCLIVAIFIAIFFIYWSGVRVGAANCTRNVVTDIAVQQKEIIKAQGVINAEVLGRGVGDIRRILREKYTIAE